MRSYWLEPEEVQKGLQVMNEKSHVHILYVGKCSWIFQFHDMLGKEKEQNLVTFGIC